MSSNAVLIGGNMFFNRKCEGINTKVVHMANSCLYCGRPAWAKHQLKYWYIIYLFKTWRVHTKPTILDHLYPETFIGSCGVFPNPQSQHLPMLHRLTATNPLTFLNQLLAILEFWMSGYENWQIDSVEMSTICSYCLRKILLDQYLFRQCDETTHKNQLHLLSLDPQSSIDGTPISHGWL